MEWTPLNKMTYKNDLKGWLPIMGNDFHYEEYLPLNEIISSKRNEFY